MNHEEVFPGSTVFAWPPCHWDLWKRHHVACCGVRPRWSIRLVLADTRHSRADFWMAVLVFDMARAKSVFEWRNFGRYDLPDPDCLSR